MITPEDLLEPIKSYNSFLKNEHHNNAVAFFNEMLKKANIDEEANKITANKIYELDDKLNNQNKSYKKSKRKNAVCLIFGILLILLGAIFIFLSIEKPIWILPSILCILLGIGLLILKSKSLKKKLKTLEKAIKELEESLSIKKKEAYSQLEPLFNQYDWNMAAELVNKTVPLFEMDKYFDVSRLSYLQDSFGYIENEGEDESTLYVQSGSILGNPFVIETAKVRSIIQQQYTGSTTYSYSVSVPDGKGGYRREIRTETLYASIFKPRPIFKKETWLTYGNEAAPDLSFTRTPTKGHTMNAKELNKYIEKQTKKLNKKAEKDMSSGFTPMANNKFETLFHAYNRDHETQFRLLFTPLAQNNMCDLMLNPEPYGDDFSIIKNHKINKVLTEHSQIFDYTCSINNFIHFDLKKCRQQFITYNEQYFKNFYFDFAPLMSIPLYHQYVTDDYIFNKKGKNNITCSEAEVLANKIDTSYFRPDNCSTEMILKCRHLSSNDNLDIMNIDAYGYQTIERVETVTKIGSDGHFHTIHIHWIEYIPVSKQTTFDVQKHEIKRQDVLENERQGKYSEFINNNVLKNAIIFNKGLCGFIPKDGIASNIGLNLDKILNK